jgi:hypothetical protein
MSFRHSVTIVASPRPRVGKTLLARLLTDFHLQEDRSVAAFDINAGEGTLAQFLPEHVTRSAIDDLRGQMALFDRLMAEDGTPKIVDVVRKVIGAAQYQNKYAPLGTAARLSCGFHYCRPRCGRQYRAATLVAADLS